jgi:hypothetical protein
MDVDAVERQFSESSERLERELDENQKNLFERVFRVHRLSHQKILDRLRDLMGPTSKSSGPSTRSNSPDPVRHQSRKESTAAGGGEDPARAHETEKQLGRFKQSLHECQCPVGGRDGGL